MNESTSESDNNSGRDSLLALLQTSGRAIGLTFSEHQFLTNETFADEIFISKTFFEKGLTITNCIFEKGLHIAAVFSGCLEVVESSLDGNVRIEIWPCAYQAVQFTAQFRLCKIRNHLYFASIASLSTVNFRDCEISGVLEISRGHIEGVVHFTFSSRLCSGGHLRIGNSGGGPSNFSPGAYSQHNLECEGSVNDTFNLDHAIIEDNARISISKIQGECLVFLRKINIAERGRIEISDSNLSLASVTGTNLDRVYFTRVTWPSTKRGNRSAILDDENVSKNDFSIKIGSNERAHRYFKDVRATDVLHSYRQLITQLESKRDFDVAEDFYVNEMEIRRTHLGDARRSWLGSSFNIIALYKYASMYGASYSRATVTLGALILAFSGAFMFSGMIATNPKISNQVTVIDYGSAVYRSQLTVGDVASDAQLALALTLSVATLQKDKPAVPIGTTGSLLTSAALVTLTAQGALILFALRRRFRRNSI